MAKKVCEDWASILLNEKTHVVIGDEKASEFVQGKRETDGVFGANDFWVQANRLIEKAFYSGTAAVTMRLIHAKNRDGQVETSADTRIGFNYISAEYIIPISCESGRITEAAFCSEHITKGTKYLLLEAHVLADGNYVIKNYRFNIDNGNFSPEPLPEGIVPEFRTGSNVPWFAVISPNIENNIIGSNGLGISVFHGAIDILKGIDYAYNNFVKDFELGGKKVFMQQSLVESLSDGTKVAPDDVGQQLFHYLPASIKGDADEPLIKEFNPSIRVAENTDGIQSALDYLSFKCGLGNKHYQFNAGSIVTATQYTGDKQDLIQNAHKHYISVEKFLLSVVRSVIHIGNCFFDLGADENTEIEIEFDKSVIIDENAERMQDMQDVRDRTMARWEYRVKWKCETEEQAKKMIAEIDGEQSDNDLMDFGDGEA
jgi:A118 family predicted phage portal protein